MKIEKMTVRELIDLKARVETQIPVAKATEIEALRTRIDEMAAQHGFATVEILSPSGKARNKRKQTARWKDPKTGVEWAGAGRRPHNYKHERAVQIQPL